MEKLIYLLWRPPALDSDDFRDSLLQELAPRLLDDAVHGLRIAAADSAVAPAAELRQEQLCGACDAMLSIWVDSAYRRSSLEELLTPACERFAGYAVAESAPLVAAEREGERVAGMNQVVFLQRPERLTREAWLKTWLEDHTGVAIETQSTFAYRQNMVVRPLTEGAPAIDAIVEEAFPEAAMTSQHAFYDAADDAELQARLNTMIESCARFIDFDKLNVLPTSDYLVKGLAPASSRD